MSSNLGNEIEIILSALGKVFTDKTVLADFEALLVDINAKNYLSVVEDVIKLAVSIAKDL